MKKLFNRGAANPLISGSFIVTIGSTIGNIFNYLFHLSMGRQLTPANYGTLTALISVLSIFGILSSTITTIIAKYVSKYRAKDNKAMISHILKSSTKKILFGLVLLSFVYPFIKPMTQSFLHIQDNTLLNITALGIFITLLIAVNMGGIQGLLFFKHQALFSSGGSILRFIFAFSLVNNGFGVRGAAIAFILSYLIPYLLTFIPLKKYFMHKKLNEPLHFKEIIEYSLPALIAIGGLGALVSTDIILVKHYFSDTISGYYSALSVISRVIFFGTGSITMVMFPIIAGKYAKKENYNSTFLLSFTLVLFSGLSLTLLYYIFPDKLIKLFYSNESYLKEARSLGIMGLFYTLFSIANLFVNFFLSISKTKIAALSIIASGLQITLISFYHESLSQIIFVSISAVSTLLFIFVTYYIYSELYKNIVKK